MIYALIVLGAIGAWLLIVLYLGWREARSTVRFLEGYVEAERMMWACVVCGSSDVYRRDASSLIGWCEPCYAVTFPHRIERAA